MTVLQRALVWLRLRKRHLAVDANVLAALKAVAERERCSPSAAAAALLRQALMRQRLLYRHVDAWQQLSPREQEVTALVCLDYTNRQIAMRLVLSEETVKSHVSSTLAKFRLRNRQELRRALSEWDFSGCHGDRD